MKKQKVIILGNEQLDKQDSAAIHELQEGLHHLDQFPVYTPDLSWFEQRVAAEKQQIRKKLIRDLSIFLIIALIILTGIIVSLFQMPVVFMFLQLFTTIFIVFYTGARFLKKVSG
ncbi:YxlC family protein [Neobacillus sp. NPDC058068]|uniref:YxlC family protein n=1 Tax=Neobacillus sp. NPDC058068 TaxID=3346325 RepID=UPI0036DF2CC5